MSMPSAYRSPFIVTMWANNNADDATWARESFAEAHADLTEFYQLGLENQRGILLTIRDRGGRLITQIATPEFQPALDILPGVPS